MLINFRQHGPRLGKRNQVSSLRRTQLLLLHSNIIKVLPTTFPISAAFERCLWLNLLRKSVESYLCKSTQ
jgi:hypothetical protein